MSAVLTDHILPSLIIIFSLPHTHGGALWSRDTSDNEFPRDSTKDDALCGNQLAVDFGRARRNGVLWGWKKRLSSARSVSHGL